MKIVFFGDSITDMGRDYNANEETFYTGSTYGTGYPLFVASELYTENPEKYLVMNRGISGNRVVSLYERLKPDVWALKPDVLSVLIGVNDVWHDIDGLNMGVELPRYEKVYRMLIEETLERLPNIKIMLMEPFILKGISTNDLYSGFLQVKDYAKVVKKLAKEYNLPFVPLQDKLDEVSKKFDAKYYLADGVHPNVAGAKLIATEWLKVFKEKVEPITKR